MSKTATEPEWPQPLCCVAETLPSHDALAEQAAGLAAPSRQAEHLLWALVAVGLVARSVRYVVRFPLWGDEVALAANLLDRGWFELLQPLDHDQVAPIGFLWAELASVRLVGFSEYALRLPALLCGLASVLMFVRFASRMVQGASLLLGVGIFAVSYPCIRYAAEAKQYGCELFFSLLLLLLLAEWLATGKPKWLWLLAVAMPISLLFSFPGVFVAAGVSLSVAVALIMARALTMSRWNNSVAGLRGSSPVEPSPVERTFAGADRAVPVQAVPSALPESIPALVPQSFPQLPATQLSAESSAQSATTLLKTALSLCAELRYAAKQSWLAWAVANLLLLVAAITIYFVAIRPQSQAHLSDMQACWAHAFVPLDRPWQLPGWLLDTFTGQMLAYPVGGHCYGSTLTFLLCATALVVWWRGRHWIALCACVLPMVFTLLAAALRRYPCGDMVRFQLYLAPIFCLLAGEGLTLWLSWLLRRRLPRPQAVAAFDSPASRPVVIACAILMVIGFGSVIRDVVRPYKADIDRQYRCLVERLWSADERAGKTVCLWSDLGVSFSPETWHSRAAAMYLCNKRIYASSGAPRGAVGQAHPHVQVVEFYCPDRPYIDQQRTAWLEQMEKHRRLARICYYALGDAKNPQGGYRAEAIVTVYCFEPIESDGQAVAAVELQPAVCR